MDTQGEGIFGKRNDLVLLMCVYIQLLFLFRKEETMAVYNKGSMMSPANTIDDS